MRFALSKEALKMTGMSSLAAVAVTSRAISRVVSALSITQGPAMSTRGPSPPIVTLPTCTALVSPRFLILAYHPPVLLVSPEAWAT